MFQMRREQHSYVSFSRGGQGSLVQTEIAVDADVMVHESGFRLIRFGNVAPIKGIMFRYVSQNTAFDFHADRRHWGGTVTGTYSVAASFKTGQMLGDKPWPIGREKMEAIAVDIEIGLRAWPPEQPDETRPIGVVHFLFYGWTPGTRYEFALSEPLALRESPPSTRWSENIIHHCLGRNRDGTDKLRPCESLIRDDGVQVIRIATLRGPADDGPDMYRYIEQGFAFDFTAERRFSLLVVTDTWEVRLDPPGRDGLSAGKQAGLGAGRRREIVGNIEEALFAWTPAPGETEVRKVPVNRVVFLDAP